MEEPVKVLIRISAILLTGGRRGADHLAVAVEMLQVNKFRQDFLCCPRNLYGMGPKFLAHTSHHNSASISMQNLHTPEPVYKLL